MIAQDRKRVAEEAQALQVSELKLSNQLQAQDMFDEYQNNKVAFDKKYADSILEFEGTISEISNDFNCASIKIVVGDNSLYAIHCNNCPEDIDGWSDEVSQVALGERVLIRGFYSNFSSDKYQMSFYKCNIVR